MICNIAKEHRAALLSIIEDSGQFDKEGLAHVAATLDEHFNNPQEAIWLSALDDGPVGVAYCAPEPVTAGTWNLLMLWVKRGYEGRGFGQALITYLEKELSQQQARLVIVETSQLPEFKAARAFYERQGFQREAEIKDFFAVGDNKVIYTKALR